MNSGVSSMMGGSMISDLSPRKVKAVMGPKLEITAGLFLLCVGSVGGVCGRSSVRKESNGRETCQKGMVVGLSLTYKPFEETAQ